MRDLTKTLHLVKKPRTCVLNFTPVLRHAEALEEMDSFIFDAWQSVYAVVWTGLLKPHRLTGWGGRGGRGGRLSRRSVRQVGESTAHSCRRGNVKVKGKSDSLSPFLFKETNQASILLLLRSQIGRWNNNKNGSMACLSYDLAKSSIKATFLHPLRMLNIRFLFWTTTSVKKFPLSSFSFR